MYIGRQFVLPYVKKCTLRSNVTCIFANIAEDHCEDIWKTIRSEPGQWFPCERYELVQLLDRWKLDKLLIFANEQTLYFLVLLPNSSAFLAFFFSSIRLTAKQVTVSQSLQKLWVAIKCQSQSFTSRTTMRSGVDGDRVRMVPNHAKKPSVSYII